MQPKNHLELITSMAKEATAEAVKDVDKNEIYAGHMAAMRINVDILHAEIYKVYHGGMSKFYRDVTTTNYRAFVENVDTDVLARDRENRVLTGLLVKAKEASIILLQDHFEQTMDQLGSGMSQKDEIIQQALGTISKVFAAAAQAAAQKGPTKPAGLEIMKP